MTRIEILAGFEREIGLLDDVINKPKTKDSEYWIYSGIMEFVKTRYSGNNYKLTGFEQTQKRIEDLKSLVVPYIYTVTSDDYSGTYQFVLPSDYLITVGESVKIYSNDSCWPKVNNQPTLKSTDVLETTLEEVDRDMENSLSEFHLNANRARPLRLFSGNNVILYTDKQYWLSSYTLTYLKKPVRFSLDTDVFIEYTDMPEETHKEFIKLAARQYIENKGIPRYESYLNEINSQE